MRIATMMAIVGITAHAETMTVYLQNSGIVPLADLYQSKVLATEMFKTAGVHIQFRTGEPPVTPSRFDRTLIVSLANHTPENDQPGALAYALPYEGVHINRILRSRCSRRCAVANRGSPGPCSGPRDHAHPPGSQPPFRLA